MNSSEQDRLYGLFERVTPAASVFAVAVGVLTLFGWLFDLDILKSGLPGLTYMKPNSALGFILSGISLWGIQTGDQGLRIVSRVFSGVVLLLGLFTLWEYLNGVTLGIDRLLIHEITNLIGDIPGRMSVNSALCFSALGAALLLLSRGNGGMVVAIHALAMIPILGAGAALIGYAFNIEEFLVVKLNYKPMAFNTAAAFVLLALGVVNARPEYPLRRFMISNSAAGDSVRRLLPAVTIFTLVTGGVIMYGSYAGYFSEAFALPLFMATSIAGQYALMLWNARMLYETGVQQERAEQERQTVSQYARSLIEASLDPLVTISAEGKITDVNEATVKATGAGREALIGSDFSNYFTEPDKARAGYQEVFAKGLVTDYPLTLRHVSGKLMDVLYNACVYRDVNGEVIGVFAAARDITERKLVEDRNRYLAAIVESSDDAIIGKTLEGVITSWNKGAERMYGYTAKEAIGKPLSILIPPGHEDEIHRILEDIRAGKHVKHFETVRKKKNCENIYVSLSISPISEADGGIVGAATVARDVTERKRVEEELRTTSLYARSLIEASLDPLVTISVDGKITDVNEATAQATGVAREALIGSDFSNYFTNPDKARAGYRQVFAKGFVTDYPLTLRHVSGKVMEVLYNACVYHDVSGEVIGVFAAARDITGRKKAEQELLQLSLRNQLILDSAGDGIYGLDLEGRCTFANPAASQMFGFTIDELVGGHAHSMIHHTKPDGSPFPQEECLVLAAYKEGAVHRGGDVYWRKDGSSFPVEFVSTPIREAGKITGAVVAFRDVTESKRAEEELRKYHEQLEELVSVRTSQLETANKDLEGFAYSVSHDLRVPLRAIDGFSHQVLKRYEDKLDDEGKRYLNVVRDNTKKMSQLIDDILAFSRMGRLGLSVSEVNMEELAHAVFDELKPSLAERQFSIDIKALPLCHGDPSMLRQVWVNLLGNAIKFTRAKDAALVEIGGHADGAEHIYYVKDNGAGFDMQYADKLFGVFQRLHGVEEFEGTGIGLAIVKRIITRHGGRVWAEGKVNDGAIFYFTLPG